MATGRIDTARFNEVVPVESLNPDQLAAVVKIRKLAELQQTTPYIIGAFVQRNKNLNRFGEQAKRLANLMTATREIKIAEFKEQLDPYHPALVAVWSAWCEQNGVNPEMHVFAGASAVSVEAEAKAEAEILAAIDRTTREMATPEGPPLKRKQGRYNPGSQAEAERILRTVLADGKEHDLAEIHAAAPSWLNQANFYNVANKLGITRRVQQDAGTNGFRKSFWRLPPVDDRFRPEVAAYEGDWDSADFKLPRVYASTHPGLEEKIDKAYRRIQRVGRRFNASPTTVARWAEMKLTPWGGLYGSRKMPDREGDEGLEVADEILRGSMPLSPCAVISRRERYGEGGV